MYEIINEYIVRALFEGSVHVVLPVPGDAQLLSPRFKTKESPKRKK